MIRNLKVLGLALVAVFALTAVAASSASAFTNFEAEATASAFKGVQSAKSNSKFTAAGATITCTEGTFRGMITSTKTETTETSDSTAGSGVEYNNCTFIFIKTKVNTHHCNYRFHAAGTVDVVANGATKADQEECEKNGITFEAAGCKVAVFPQTGINGISYANLGEKTTREVEVKPGSTNIAYTGSGSCPKNGANTNGKYEGGNTPVQGFTNTEFGTRAGVFIS